MTRDSSILSGLRDPWVGPRRPGSTEVLPCHWLTEACSSRPRPPELQYRLEHCAEVFQHKAPAGEKAVTPSRVLPLQLFSLCTHSWGSGVRLPGSGSGFFHSTSCVTVDNLLDLSVAVCPSAEERAEHILQRGREDDTNGICSFVEHVCIS